MINLLVNTLVQGFVKSFYYCMLVLGLFICVQSLKQVLTSLVLLSSNLKSSRGGLEVEHLLHKLNDSVSVDQAPLGACMIIWYQWTRYVMYVLDVCYMQPKNLHNCQ